MEWYFAALLILGSLMVLMLSGLPVAFSFLSVCIVGTFVFLGGVNALPMLVLSLYESVKHFSRLSDKELARVKEEVGDILLFLTYFCHELDIDLFAEADRKIDINEKKYPVEKAKGNCLKYTEYDD